MSYWQSWPSYIGALWAPPYRVLVVALGLRAVVLHDLAEGDGPLRARRHDLAHGVDGTEEHHVDVPLVYEPELVLAHEDLDDHVPYLSMSRARQEQRASVSGISTPMVDDGQ